MMATLLSSLCLHERHSLKYDSFENHRTLRMFPDRTVVMKGSILQTLCMWPSLIVSFSRPPHRTLHLHGMGRTDFPLWFADIQKAAGGKGNQLRDQQLSRHDIPIIVDSCVAFITQYGEGWGRRRGRPSSGGLIPPHFIIIIIISLYSFHLCLSPSDHWIPFCVVLHLVNDAELGIVHV